MVRRVLGIKPSPPRRSAQLERELRYQSRSCPFLGLRLTLDKSPLPFPPPGKHAKDHLGSCRVRRRVGKAHKGLPRLGSRSALGHPRHRPASRRDQRPRPAPPPASGTMAPREGRSSAPGVCAGRGRRSLPARGSVTRPSPGGPGSL